MSERERSQRAAGTARGPIVRRLRPTDLSEERAQ